MLGAADRQLVRGVKVDQLRDGVERRAVLTQHELAVFALGELHVHEALAASGREQTPENRLLTEAGEERDQRQRWENGTGDKRATRRNVGRMKHL